MRCAGFLIWLLAHTQNTQNCAKRAVRHTLRRVQMRSKSDPMAVLLEPQPGGTWREVGRTEMAANTSDPVWTVPFRVTYNFEKLQPLRLLLVDLDEGQSPAVVDPAKCVSCGCAHVVQASNMRKDSCHQVLRRSHRQTVVLSPVTLRCAAFCRTSWAKWTSRYQRR